MSTQPIQKKTMHELIEMRAGKAGERAAIAGTRIDVWLIIQAFGECEENFDCLAQAFTMLSEDQLRSALSYYKSHSVEIDAWIRSNEDLTESKTRELYPELFQSS